MAFPSLKHTWVGKNNIIKNNVDLEQKHCFFQENLQICNLQIGKSRKFADLRINHYKFADLQTGTS
jgi:hypothetical protein